MSKPITIFAESDSNFFPHLIGLILSIREKPESEQVDISIFDLGLTASQKTWLNNYVTNIVTPDWGLPPVPGMPAPFKGLFATPRTPALIPNYEIYVHIDSDAWVQDWAAVELLIEGAKRSNLAIVPELERSFCSNYHYANGYRRFAWDCFNQCRGPEAAEKFINYPILNSGVFSMRADSPYWGLWMSNLEKTLEFTPNFMMNQTALNVAVFERITGDRPSDVELLPITCNWTCYIGLPFYSKDQACLVEPYLPHQKIGILHRNSEDFRRQGTFTVRTCEGDTVKMNLKYREGDFSHASPPGAEEKLSGWGSNWWQGHKTDLDIKDY